MNIINWFLLTSNKQLLAILLLGFILLGCGGGSSSSKINEPILKNTLSFENPSPFTIYEGETFTFTPTVNGLTNNTSFTITSMPPWTTFNDQTGELTGKPSFSQQGDYQDIKITASNSDNSATLTLSISVKDVFPIIGNLLPGNIQNAQVFFDINLNGKFDEATEISSLTNNNGEFNFSIKADNSEDTLIQIKHAPLLAFIGEGADDLSSNDDDFLQLPVTLYHPPLLEFPTPLANEPSNEQRIYISPLSTQLTKVISAEVSSLINKTISVDVYTEKYSQTKQQFADKLSFPTAIFQQNYLQLSAATLGITEQQKQQLLVISNNFFVNEQVLQSKILDSDLDGILNYLDIDVDGDGFINTLDAFPANKLEQFDTDFDGLSDKEDLDDDNDGILDIADFYPLDKNLSAFIDKDNDGWPAEQDNDDNNAAIPALAFQDTDKDGWADQGGLQPDNDDDNDYFLDENDAFPLLSTESVDTDNDGIGNNQDRDDDGDFVADNKDAFPLDHSKSSTNTVIPNPAPLFFKLTTQTTGLQHQWDLINIDAEGIEKDSFNTSGGMAIGDYDQDGLVDLFIVGGNKSPSKLYKKQHDGTYIDVAKQAGVQLNSTYSGPSFVDTDNDGDLDLFVGGMGSTTSKLFINQGDGTFSETIAPEISKKFTLSSSFADIDNDGDLDMALSHYASKLTSDSEHLWVNEGNNQFTSISQNSGIMNSKLNGEGNLGGVDFTFTPNFADINNDGNSDLLFSSDYETTVALINNGGGQFSDNTIKIGQKQPKLFGMGASLADIDNDGDLDWFITNIVQVHQSTGSLTFPGNMLFSNNGDGSFTDISYKSNIFNGGWGWGVCLSDFNNDGLLDIFNTNGWDLSSTSSGDFESHDKDTVVMFLATESGRFIRQNVELGLEHKGQGRAVICFDQDNDGDIDILLSNHDKDINALVFYENTGQLGNYLNIELRSYRKNTYAIGARVYLKDAKREQMREVNINSNFTAQNPAPLHFGLGDITAIEYIKIVWPDGEVQIITDINVNQSLLIEQI